MTDDPAVLPAAGGVKFAARYMGVSASTIRRLEASGALRSARVGGRVLFRVADLDAFLAAAADGGDAA